MWLPGAGFANLVCCSRSRRGRNGAGLRKGRSRRRKTLKPLGCLPRRNNCMSGISGALPLPLAGGQERAKGKVDYRNTEEGLLVRRCKKATMASDVVERYQSEGVLHHLRYSAESQRRRTSPQQVFSSLISDSEFRLPQFPAHVDLQDYSERGYDYLRKKRSGSSFTRAISAKRTPLACIALRR
jgi:hypothetical protein